MSVHAHRRKAHCLEEALHGEESCGLRSMGCGDGSGGNAAMGVCMGVGKVDIEGCSCCGCQKIRYTTKP